MAAMMLSSAAPMTLLFGLIRRKSRAAGSICVPTTIFASAPYLSCSYRKQLVTWSFTSPAACM
jgi:predicted metal-binding membrane protein